MMAGVIRRVVGKECPSRTGLARVGGNGQTAAASQGGGHQGHDLVAGVGSARGAAQVKAPVNQLGQAKMQGQGGRQDQPSIVHQAVVVKGDLDVVGVVAWWHLLRAPVHLG